MPTSLTRREKTGLLIVAGLIAVSVFMHNQPSMDDVQAQLESKAPGMFWFFMIGEGVYFAGMILMAIGLGTSLGPNPLRWASKLHALMSAESPGLVNAKVFWVGFACNVIGSLSFGGVGVYVAIAILPGGTWTLVPAAVVDIVFALFMRYLIFRRFAGRAAPPATT